MPDFDTKLKFADMKKTYKIIDDNIITDKTERSRRQEVLVLASLSRGNETFPSVDRFGSRVFRHCHSIFFKNIFRVNREEPVAGSVHTKT